jgi:hypothetical protein
MEAFATARLIRGLAVATSLAVSITCASPTSPASSEFASAPGSGAAFRQGTYIYMTLQDSSIDVGATTMGSAELRTIWGGVWRGNRVTWSSDNVAVATVDATGLVRGVGPGSANILARIDGGTERAPITVSDTVVTPPPVATQLRLTTQPTTGVTGQVLAIQPQIAISDASNTVVPSSTASVTAAISGGIAILGGTTTVSAVNGIATFTDLRITGVGSFTLTFTSDGLAPAASQPVTIVAGAPALLVMVAQPSSSAVSGSVLAAQPAVALRDAFGNPVSQAGVAVTAAIASGGGTLGGATVVATDASGVARFTNLSISGTAGIRTLGFSAGGLSVAVSNPITVTVPLPPPPTGAMLFASDWSSATGITSAALMDAGKSLPWNLIGGQGLEVVPSAGLDFPTANVLKVNVLQVTSGFGLLRRTGLPTLQLGASRYYRWYSRVTIPDGVSTSDPETHPHQDGNAGSQTNWSFNVYHNAGGGTWRPQLRHSVGPWPNNRWTGPALSKSATYRFELQVQRVSETTFNMHVRIYGSNNVLLFDDDDFRNDNGTATLASNPTFAFNSVANTDGFNAGLNGLAGTDWHPSAVYMYQGGIAICATTWCGAYVAGERP